MGLNVPVLQLLCYAKNIGVDFSETIMIGRQTINIAISDVAAILAKIGIPRDRLAGFAEGQYAEPIFELLGARQLSSLDASDYENATHIHDLNKPLPDHLREKFSVVLDGGTLEHIFNIPQAFKNCMEMVRLGGHFIQINVANNYMGHGFWQFSPELLYRVFSPENGFSIKVVLLHEPTTTRDHGASFGDWYAVLDPAIACTRVELINHKTTLICTIAQRISCGDIFAEPPQQSDYVSLWNQHQESHTSAPLRSTSSFIRRAIPRSIKNVLRRSRSALERKKGPFERPYYRAVSDDDVIIGRFLNRDS